MIRKFQHDNFSFGIECRGIRAQVMLPIGMQVATALLASLSSKNQHTRARLAFHLCRCLAKSPSCFGISGGPLVFPLVLWVAPG